jgi:hypothetical protein
MITKRRAAASSHTREALVGLGGVGQSPGADAILSKANAKLNKSDTQEKGKIYILQLKRDRSKIKIGWAINPSNDLKIWRECCGLELELLYSSPEIPYAWQVKLLIYMELKDYRQEFECKRCSAYHYEWFDVTGNVTVNHTIRVVQKWTDWIMTPPYEKNARGVG